MNSAVQSTKTYFRSERFANLLAYWIAVGLAFQLGLVIWPIDNYSTLVYQFLYLPFLLSCLAFPDKYLDILGNADRAIALPMTILLLWVPLSVFWGSSEDALGLFFESMRVSLLILIYILAIIYLRQHSRAAFIIALLSAGALISTLALATFIDTLVSGDALGSRVSSFGLLDWTLDLNPVPAGIYFGGAAVLCFVMLSTMPGTSKTVSLALSLCAASCLAIALLTETRTAMIGVLAGLNYYFAAAGEFRRIFYLNALAALAAALFAILNTSGFLNLLFRGGLGGWRPEFWVASLESSLETIWLGRGYLEESTFTAVREEANSVAVNEQRHSHSFYLQLLYWSGLPALCVYLAILAAAFHRAKVTRKIPESRLAGTLLAYFCVVQFLDVYNIFTRPSYYWPWIWLPLAILLSNQLAPGGCPAGSRENSFNFNMLQKNDSG